MSRFHSDYDELYFENRNIEKMLSDIGFPIDTFDAIGRGISFDHDDFGDDLSKSAYEVTQHNKVDTHDLSAQEQDEDRQGDRKIIGELQARVEELQQQVNEYEYWIDEGRSPYPALGLFLEAFVPDAKAFEYSGRLNVNTVVEKMEQKLPGEYVRGMSNRTLRKIIDAAIEAWETKKEENRPQNR